MNSAAAAFEILEFWFGDAVGGDQTAMQKAFKRWFGGGEAFDRDIAARFGDRVEAALDGGLRDWEDDVRTRLALILLLDQFPRNIFRRQARAFAGDARALELAQSAVESGEHRMLSPLERVFLLMPYQHAENDSVQREGVRQFEALVREDVPPALRQFLETSLDYARQHCEIIARFGRFPYRNAVLDRTDTAEESAWLAGSGPRFGQ